jgi:RNA recognition motif-containing protein
MSDAQAPDHASENGVSVAQESPEQAGFKVFAGNLAYSTTDEGLKTFFAPVANDILSAQIIMRGPRSAGYGFVALATAEAAEKAVESLNKTELDGRTVVIEIAKPSDQKDKEKKERKKSRRPGRRGIKAIPGEVSEAEANGEAPKSDGAAVPESSEAAKPKKKKKKSARKPRKSTPVAEGDAVGDAPAAVEKPPASEDAPAPRKTRTRTPRAPRVVRSADEAPAGEPSKTMLFVANLGFNVDDDALRSLFVEAGISVESARVVRWRWGRPRKSKGYGFVDVGSEEEQNKAIAALQGKEVNNRPIVVKVAVNASQADEEKATPDDASAAPHETVV